jgi:GNAT superfamily N-acetyltransferase
MSKKARVLTTGDIADAVRLSTFAEWNQTADDWGMLLRLAPDSCFGIEDEGRLAATTTLICYGRTLAWIGMVLTDSNCRGRGFATSLVKHAIEVAGEKGIGTIKLDATEQGRSIYERFGFRAEQSVERWWRPVGVPSSKPDLVAPDQLEYELDTIATGVDRTPLLNALQSIGQALGQAGALLLGRPGRLNSYMGPCVAREPRFARPLIERWLRTLDQGCFWDLLPNNKEAGLLAQSLGFIKQRVLTRMVLGPELRGREDLVYAVAGFELG